jgi:nitrogen regulatory protein P-II 2
MVVVSQKGAIMKLIVAVIKPFKLDEVRAALDGAGVVGMTVTEVNGYGRQKGRTEIYRGSEYVSAYMPKLRLDVAVSDEHVDRVVEAIQSSARTGQIGDGKIFVTPLEEVVRVRTGEIGDEAV